MRPESRLFPIGVAEARKIEEAYGPDPEWDARMQAKWDAYDATPTGQAFAELCRYKSKVLDGHETVT
jgi:plasmid maintenance system antidote protein VapI